MLKAEKNEVFTSMINPWHSIRTIFRHHFNVSIEFVYNLLNTAFYCLPYNCPCCVFLNFFTKKYYSTDQIQIG